jgi:hypothetical protein
MPLKSLLFKVGSYDAVLFVRILNKPVHATLFLKRVLLCPGMQTCPAPDTFSGNIRIFAICKKNRPGVRD